MVKFIDDLQSYIVDIEAIAPGDYTDDRKKRLLLSNVQPAPGISHLIQKYRDNEYMTYQYCASYLREKAFLFDHTNTTKPNSRLMHVEDKSFYKGPSPGHSKPMK